MARAPRNAKSLAKTLEIRTSPHVVGPASVDVTMVNVVLALLPATGFSVWAFGLAPALLVTTTVGSSLLAEWLVTRRKPSGSTLRDGSAAVTGLLFGLTLPPGLPLWMAAVGGVMAIVLGKAITGGLGTNPFNPALAARAVLQATFPVAMTSFAAPFVPDRFRALPGSLLALPFTRPVYDAVAGATPLAAWKFAHQSTGVRELLLGFVPGSIGETCPILLALGGAWLIARNLMSWRTPAAIFGAVALFSGALHSLDPARFASPMFTLFSGGLALGAFFMATDPVTSPIGRGAQWIHGVLVGVLVIVIRVWGGMPEGVMYAILLGNAAAPHLDRLVRARVYGTRKQATA
jgi:electron transport complex protein RnfD